METGLTTQAVTREVRLRQWREIIHARQESGLTVKDYCESHGITKDSYYYWQRLVREAAIAEAGPMFAELLPDRQEKRTLQDSATFILPADIQTSGEGLTALYQR